MDVLIPFIAFIVFIALGYIAGTAIEKKHYRIIEARERELLYLPVITARKVENESDISEAQLVIGSVVISLDYFKRFLAGLRNIVGGRIKSYETLLDRGRREAILRMKEKAREMNADIVLNMRFETSGIGKVTRKRRGRTGCFEILAYGTAMKLKK